MIFKLLPIFILTKYFLCIHIEIYPMIIETDVSNTLNLVITTYDSNDPIEDNIKYSFLSCYFDKEKFCKNDIDIHIFELFYQNKEGTIYPIFLDKKSLAILKLFCKNFLKQIDEEANDVDVNKIYKKDKILIRNFPYQEFDQCDIEPIENPFEEKFYDFNRIILKEKVDQIIDIDNEINKNFVLNNNKISQSNESSIKGIETAIEKEKTKLSENSSRMLGDKIVVF
jgi:hypothetical protein